MGAGPLPTDAPEAGSRLRRLEDKQAAVGLAGQLKENLELQKGVATAAVAAQLGDYFQYVIEHPVSLPRQKSALLPIVNQEVAAARVSIYNPAAHPKFPLLGLRFKNGTGLHLMQGPITVFDGSTYAGDARVPDLQPNEERLLSYAIDLGTEVESVVQPDSGRLIQVRLRQGILHSTTKHREARVYNLKNRSDQERTVLIEHPFRPSFKLIEPEKPSERARDVYRFEVPLPAGQSASRKVVEERDDVQQITLTNTSDETIRFFLRSAVSSAKVKEALKEALALKAKLEATRRHLGERTRRRDEITQDQTRLRANLREVPPTAAAYKRYLDKFDQQETELEQLQGDIRKLQDAEARQRQDLDAFLLALNLE